MSFKLSINKTPFKKIIIEAEKNIFINHLFDLKPNLNHKKEITRCVQTTKLNPFFRFRQFKICNHLK